ncbi:MAG TPA: outer membrane beta-barrel protein [Novosphingobium sp.]|nr:outer membrane beta-barrel protein [Novosphingobium sp.]
MAFAQAIGASSSIVIDPELARNDVAGARIDPAFQRDPIRVGPLFAQAGFSVVGGYESNVFNRPQAESDAVVSLAPRLTLQADLPRHDLSFAAVGRLRRFARQQSENSEEFGLNGKGQLDLAEQQAMLASIDYSHEIEPRSSVGSVADAAEPASFRRFASEFGARLQFGALRLVPQVGFRRADYVPLELAQGGAVNQSFRNTRTFHGELSIEYDFTGFVSGFASGSVSDVDSPDAPAERRRDSRSYSVSVGLRGDLSPLIFGEIGVGYQARHYKLPRYRDFEGATFRADVQWYLTPLVTLRLQAARAFENSGNPLVAGILSDKATISAYYDPLRNLRISLSGSCDVNKYREVSTRAFRASVRLQAQYLVNRSLSIGAYTSFLRQNVRGQPIVNEFTSFGAGIGMTLAL